ncbi:MAG: hypothetical protein M3144_07570, partial [Actinomycetota bacterium]|nr:hypothetical protein [Actinomycetota bacterium]
VTTDVPAHALVVGNPARRIGWACTCGRRLPHGWRCDCGRRFEPDGAGGLHEQKAIETIGAGPHLSLDPRSKEPAS